jgi:hypothetical protein
MPALFVPPLFFPKYHKNIAQKWHLTENCGTNTATWCNISATKSTHPMIVGFFQCSLHLTETSTKIWYLITNQQVNFAKI